MVTSLGNVYMCGSNELYGPLEGKAFIQGGGFCIVHPRSHFLDFFLVHPPAKRVASGASFGRFDENAGLILGIGFKLGSVRRKLALLRTKVWPEVQCLFRKIFGNVFHRKNARQESRSLG